MRRILRKIAKGDIKDLGDTSTLADPSVVDNLVKEGFRNRLSIAKMPSLLYNYDKKKVRRMKILKVSLLLLIILGLTFSSCPC